MRPRTTTIRCVLLSVSLAASVVAWAQPEGYAINTRGDFSDSSQVGALWSIDLSTGEADLEGRSRISNYLFIEGLAFGPDDRLYGTDDDTNSIVLVGTQSGNAVPLGGAGQFENNMGLPAGNHDFGATFTCTGELLVSADSPSLGQVLYQADLETGELTLIGSLGIPIVDLASIGDTVYGIGRGINGDGQTEAPNLYRIDPETADNVLVGGLGDAAGTYNKAGLAVDADGVLWGVLERRDPRNPAVSIASRIVRIDPASGAAEAVSDAWVAGTGEPLVGIESLAIAPPGQCQGAPVFEPVEVPSASLPARLVLLILLAALGVVHLGRLQG
ncbi:MAG: hypothetical protein HND55_02225 [Pseudomonadota bacterium]|nr:MAG: hypothetical protein HND55_02225 [Pseudomonadota bacterium]